MLGNHHITTSLALGSAVYAIANPPSNIDWITYGIIMTGVAVGSIYPDRDTANSKINQLLDEKPSGDVHRGSYHTWGGLIEHAWLLPIALYMFLGIFWAIGSMFFSVVHFRLFFCNFHFGFWTPIIIKLTIGYTLGYFLHMLEDSWSVSGILWTGIKPGNYDEWVLENLHMYARKPLKVFEVNGTKVPIRHKWGRGYRVGSGDEYAIMLLLIVPSWLLFWFRQKPMIEYAIHLGMVAVHWTLIALGVWFISYIVVGAAGMAAQESLRKDRERDAQQRAQYAQKLQAYQEFQEFQQFKAFKRMQEQKNN